MKEVQKKTQVISILDGLCTQLESTIDILHEQCVRSDSEVSSISYEVQDMFFSRLESYEQILNTMKIEIAELNFYADTLTAQDLYAGSFRIVQLYNFLQNDFQNFLDELKQNPTFPNTSNKLDWH